MDTKKKHLISNILIASAMSFAVVGCGFSYLYNEYQKPQVSRAYDYDDNDYIVELSASEVSTTTFTHLADYLLELNEGNDYFLPVRNAYRYTTCEYLESTSATFSYDFSDMIKFQYRDASTIINLYLSNLGNGRDKGIFEVYGLNDGQPVEYSYLKFTLNSAVYADFKSAVESDLNIGTDYTNDTFLQDIISLLVGGISATATGIGTGLNTLVSDIAIQNGAMSSFMSIVLIFGAIALAFALSRWVVNLISSLGQRNR